MASLEGIWQCVNALNLLVEANKNISHILKERVLVDEQIDCTKEAMTSMFSSIFVLRKMLETSIFLWHL